MAIQGVISITDHLQYLEARKLKVLREIAKLTRKINKLSYKIHCAESDVIKTLKTKLRKRGKSRVRKNARKSQETRTQLKRKSIYSKIKGKKVNKKRKKPPQKRPRHDSESE